MSLTIREEQFLAKIAGEDVTTPVPLTREEQFLAKIAGDDVITPVPFTREEQLLSKIAENGGGGGGGGGDFNGVELHLSSVSGGYVITESLSEIKSLINSGKTPYIAPDDASLGDKYIAYKYKLYNDEMDVLYFGRIPFPFRDNDYSTYPTMEFYSDDTQLVYHFPD